MVSVPLEGLVMMWEALWACGGEARQGSLASNVTYCLASDAKFSYLGNDRVKLYWP